DRDLEMSHVHPQPGPRPPRQKGQHGKLLRSAQESCRGRGRTSTRLSKNVAPPPMSVRTVAVVRFTLLRPGLSLLQYRPVATATAGRTDPVSATRAWKLPRSL